MKITKLYRPLSIQDIPTRLLWLCVVLGLHTDVCWNHSDGLLLIYSLSQEFFFGYLSNVWEIKSNLLARHLPNLRSKVMLPWSGPYYHIIPSRSAKFLGLWEYMPPSINTVRTRKSRGSGRIPLNGYEHFPTMDSKLWGWLQSPTESAHYR